MGVGMSRNAKLSFLGKHECSDFYSLLDGWNNYTQYGNSNHCAYTRSNTATLSDDFSSMASQGSSSYEKYDRKGSMIIRPEKNFHLSCSVFGLQHYHLGK